MNPIPVIIADDDADMRVIMRRIIERAGGFETVGEADNGETALAIYDKLHPKVVILDVEMPGMNGLECARAIQDRDPHTIIIFSTAHDNYMLQAFEVYAFDYLIKPFKLERALKTLSLVKERLTAPGETAAPKPREKQRTGGGRLILRSKDGMSFVSIDKIALVQREDRMTALYTSDGKRYVTGETLGEVEEKLPGDVFFRTHKSYIVNTDMIDSITPYGRWTYIVRLQSISQDALITHDRFEELQKRLVEGEET